ncbi:DUF6515 family protein [Mucilaginibacter sp. UR6-11]|uniref:DUF6515 family protein n=1 Tax=Mucilaginibacter sp. UR6-11 TaxID=1435644 RepID=UPI001E3EFA84|nr:DUF6515 family protein [Mucilaginibacter sp. UR6-11]MCC8424451.1 hypothetical protein [Mucilaginibacter sp. UR6-11]
MKKIYSNLIGFAFTGLLCFSIAIPASAQRGGEHSDDKRSGGGSTPPPAAPSRPAPQPQVQQQRPAPQQQQQQQQVQQQRPAPQQQQQQVQQQRPAPQQQPQMQRGNSQQQNNGYGQRLPNAGGSGSVTMQPRGEQHRESPSFTPTNPRNSGSFSRHYPTFGQRGAAYNYNPRAYSFNYNHGNGYRSYPGLRFGRNYTSPRPSGFFYRNRGYYSTYYSPQLGFRLSVLPYGYYPFYFGPDQYFYNDGLYYRQQDNEYTVVEPPIGATIDRLPSKAQPIAINGMQYYELNGVYYQPITRDDGTLVYQIAGKDGELTTDDVNATSPDDLPQVGDLVDNLPEGCKAIRLNNQKYYVSQEGYYFQDAIDTNGDKVFKIVGTPTDGPGN